MKLVIDLGTKATGASDAQRSEVTVARIVSFVAMLLGAKASVYARYRAMFAKNGERIASFWIDTLGDDAFPNGDVEHAFYEETGRLIRSMPESYLNPIGESEATMIAVALGQLSVSDPTERKRRDLLREQFVGLMRSTLAAAEAPPIYYSLVPTTGLVPTIPERSPAAT